MMSQGVKNKKYVRHETKSSGVRVVNMFFTRCDVSSVIYYSTHARKNVQYIYVLYNKNSNGLLKDFEKNKSADMDLMPSVCMSTTNENAHRSHVIVQCIILYMLYCIVLIYCT